MLSQQLLNGLMLGGTYALVAVGYALVFGVLRLLHLAHGAIFMVGAFIGLVAVRQLDAGPVLAVLLGALGAAAIGVLMELLVFRPIRRRGGNFLAPMVGSIGAGLIIEEIATKLFGAQPTPMPGAFGNMTFTMGTVTLGYAQLFILLMSAVAMAALHLFVSYSRYGIAIRATAESDPVSRTLGIPVDRVVMLTLAIASALAGMAGVLAGFAYNAVSPFMGIEMSIKGLAVMLIGGLGSLYGAMAGGMILGIAEVLSVAYLASSYRDAFAFGLMIVILLWRPRGLFAVGLPTTR